MNKPIVAIVYDFDNTLSTTDMEEYSFIPSVGMQPKDFWKKSDELAHANNMDFILSTLMLMVSQAEKAGIKVTRDMLVSCGKDVVFHKGVEGWFDRINAYGESLGLEVRHYVVSCGLRPMIEGSSIGNKFYNIFACDYVYDETGKPVWPSLAINYSGKIQFLYRISKGVEDISEHTRLNMHLPKETRPVPFSNMIYVGDGLTDIPSMEITRSNGGYSIGVYENEEAGKYLVSDDRVDFYVKADYSEGSDMDKIVKAMLDRIRATNVIDRLGK